MVVVVVVFIMEAGKSAADLEDFSLSFFRIWYIPLLYFTIVVKWSEGQLMLIIIIK
jgi:hypothetical protein